MTKEAPKRLTREQMAELKSLDAMPDGAIDTADVPEIHDWSGAKRGSSIAPPAAADADAVAFLENSDLRLRPASPRVAFVWAAE